MRGPDPWPLLTEMGCAKTRWDWDSNSLAALLLPARIPATSNPRSVMASTRGARRDGRAKTRWDWDSNPGGQRPPAFKAGAIVHSAIPPAPENGRWRVKTVLVRATPQAWTSVVRSRDHRVVSHQKNTMGRGRVTPGQHAETWHDTQP